MFNGLLFVICLVPLGLYLIMVKKHKFTTKERVLVAMLSAMSYILSLIPIIEYPQGGGINLFSMLPILLLGVIVSREPAVTAGLITGLLGLMIGGYVVHPAQLILDYIFPCMALGLSDMFGRDKKVKIAMGALVAVIVSTFSQVLSGVIFFGQFAPEGMGALVYSLSYNFSGHGVEGFLCVVILYFMPIERFRKLAVS